MINWPKEGLKNESFIEMLKIIFLPFVDYLYHIIYQIDQSILRKRRHLNFLNALLKIFSSNFDNTSSKEIRIDIVSRFASKYSNLLVFLNNMPNKIVEIRVRKVISKRNNGKVIYLCKYVFYDVTFLWKLLILCRTIYRIHLRWSNG